MKDPLTVDEDILFYAFRYALGRKSHASSTVAHNIAQNLSKMKDADIKAYVREIEECQDYGMEIDKQQWLILRNKLVEELNMRDTHQN